MIDKEKRQNNNKQDNGNNIKQTTKKLRHEFLKPRLEVVLAFIGIIGGIVGLIMVFLPYIFPEKANLEVIDYQIDNSGSAPILKVKIVNRGAKVAFLSQAKILLNNSKIEGSQIHGAGEITPQKYNWLITLKNVKQKNSIYDLKRRINADDVDVLEFVLGFEKLDQALNSKIQLQLFYNKDQKIILPTKEISIANYASYPAFIMSSSNEDLTTQLNQIENPYTIQQIIKEFSDRKYEKAASIIDKFLKHRDSQVRVFAAKYFISVRYVPAIPNLVSALQDENVDVRYWSFEAIANQGEGATSDLEKLKESPNKNVRALAKTLIERVSKSQK